MDALLILLVIYFVFYLMTKRIKRATSTGENHAHETAPRSREPENRKRNATKPTSNPMNRPEISRSGVPGVPYTPIQPMVKVNQTLYDYKGSLSAPSSEGVASGEGDVSSEGSSTAEGGEVFTPDVLQEAEKPEIVQHTQALPDQWTGDELVQGIVMKEILDKPRRWR